MEQFGSFVDNAIFFIIIVNAFLYVIAYRKNRHSHLLALFAAYLVLGCLLQVYMWYLTLDRSNNLWVAHIYFAMQFVILSLFYRNMFYKGQKRFVLYVIALVVLVLGIYYVSDVSKIMTFNLLDIFVTMLPIIAYTIVHLYNSLTKKGNFLLINSAILIYFSTSALIFFVGTIIQVEGEVAPTLEKAGRRIFMINDFMFLLYQITIFLEWKFNISKWNNRRI